MMQYAKVGVGVKIARHMHFVPLFAPDLAQLRNHGDRTQGHVSAANADQGHNGIPDVAGLQSYLGRQSRVVKLHKCPVLWPEFAMPPQPPQPAEVIGGLQPIMRQTQQRCGFLDFGMVAAGDLAIAKILDMAGKRL